jgi:hypothetical protein
MGDHEDKIRAAIAAGYNLPALSPVAMEALALGKKGLRRDPPGSGKICSFPVGFP